MWPWELQEILNLGDEQPLLHETSTNNSSMLVAQKARSSGWSWIYIDAAGMGTWEEFTGRKVRLSQMRRLGLSRETNRRADYSYRFTSLILSDRSR